MLPRAQLNQLDRLLEAALQAKGTEAAYLASILLAVQDAIRGEQLAAFACRVWKANNAGEGQAMAETAPGGKAELKRAGRSRKVG
jgi:hypothetical protein